MVKTTYVYLLPTALEFPGAEVAQEVAKKSDGGSLWGMKVWGAGSGGGA